MRKERVINLETETQVKEFIDNIDEEAFYIDCDGNAYKGNELKDAVEHYQDYDVYIGSYRVIEPYEFFFIEERDGSFFNGRRVNSAKYGDSWNCDTCNNEENALALMKNNWDRLVISEKKRKTVLAYKCYGIEEHIECKNNAEMIGVATMYRGREYVSNREVHPHIIDMIDDDLSKEISAAYIVSDGINYYYGKEIQNVFFIVEVSRAEWEDCGEIFLENHVQILA